MQTIETMQQFLVFDCIECIGKINTSYGYTTKASQRQGLIIKELHATD